MKTRPGKQLPREKGTIFKDWGGRLPVALVYPNSYYLGMSNLGIHTVYRLLNDHRRVVGERAFWGKKTREKNLPPLAIESQRPLADFAVLAFSISFELDYLNVVNILKASGLPLYATERDERHPLVIAGGPCITANPMPLSPFCDCLCIGEAEPLISTLLPVLLEGANGKRDELLKALTALPGIHVPRYDSGNPVVRQWAKNLDDYPATSVILTPDTELGDLYLIEVERGCNWGCRFCLVGTTFAPMRFRSADRLLEQAEQGLKYRKRIGLVGPAVTDHPEIEEILYGLRRMGAGLSISSLRIKPLSSRMMELLAEGGARTITLAPEAGSERLRRVIRKGFTEDDILSAISQVAAQGTKQLKLYFMLGLPTETDEDIGEIISLILKGKTIVDRQQTGTRLSLNIAPFVPKAGTPFQWLPMSTLPTLNQRLSLLKKSLPARVVQLKYESPAWSQIQAVLSRGDSSLAKVLADMEELSLAGWRRAVEKNHLDIDFYVNQRWGTSQKLPWEIIDSGTKGAHLERELARALA